MHLSQDYVSLISNGSFIASEVLGKKAGTLAESSLVDKQLMASVQSFTSYIQQHFSPATAGYTDPPTKSAPQVDTLCF